MPSFQLWNFELVSAANKTPKFLCHILHLNSENSTCRSLSNCYPEVNDQYIIKCDNLSTSDIDTLDYQFGAVV